jgi:hypothetical protein
MSWCAYWRRILLSLREVLGSASIYILRIDPSFFEVLSKFSHFFDGYKRTRQSFIYSLISALYAFGYAYFIFASEQRDGTHFTKVEAHRIKGLVLYVDVFSSLFGHFSRLLLFDAYGFPERFGSLLVNFRDYALDPTCRAEILLSVIGGTQKYVFVHPDFHYAFLCLFPPN